MDYFITCFWGQDPLRTKLCEEFCHRYPNVILLQNKTNIRAMNTVVYSFEDEGFIDYKMINKFIEGKDIRTLTLIDSDIILEPLFFFKIIKKHRSLENSPCFLTIRNSYELVNGTILDTEVPSMVSKKMYGHTGFVLSFNKKFLNSYSFNENFIYGGYDYVLTCGLLRVSNKIIKSSNFVHGEYLKLLEFDCKVSYIDSDVIHCFHGSRTERMTPWANY